jgi:hypothetical protein
MEGITIKKKKLLFKAIILILVFLSGDSIFADTNSPTNSPIIPAPTNQQDSQPKPIWLSFGSEGQNPNIGFLGRRMGGRNNEAIEVVALFDPYGDSLGFGMDYLHFFDISEQSAWFLGIGGYDVFEYYNNYANVKTQFKTAFSIGYQKQLFNKCLLGLGFNTVRNFYIQFGVALD